MSNFDEKFDFVVVGSGGGSMCAALVMRSLGKSVAILEKTEFVGGTTARAGGVMWIPNNPFMQCDGIEDSYEQAVTYLDTLVGDRPDTPGTSKERRRRYVREAPLMIEFLLSQGIKLTRIDGWPDYYDELPGGCAHGRNVIAQIFDANELGEWRDRLRVNWLRIPALHDEAFAITTYRQSWKGKWMMLKVALRTALSKAIGKRLVASGAALQGRMLQAALREGVDVRINSPVQELIVEGGVVTGVAVAGGARKRLIGAHLGVLVNAGGFSHNERMRAQYQPGTSVSWTSAAPGDTGEMIEEMMRIGAGVAQMEEMVGLQITWPPGADKAEVKAGVQSLTAAPHAILVDQSGVRYQNEGGSYMAYCKAMLERSKTVAAVPSWAIFDSQCMHKYMVAGTLPHKRKPAIWQEQGFLRQADRIEQLARLLNIEPAALEATVERFNGFVAQNHDAEFHRGERAYDRWLGDPYHKPSPTLGKLERAPFFAVPVYPGDVGTYGGVITDSEARVLRRDGSVIQGLYATGVSTASVMGRVYPGAGASIGPSFVWGYVAALHASAKQVRTATVPSLTTNASIK